MRSALERVGVEQERHVGRRAAEARAELVQRGGETLEVRPVAGVGDVEVEGGYAEPRTIAGESADQDEVDLARRQGLRRIGRGRKSGRLPVSGQGFSEHEVREVLAVPQTIVRRQREHLSISVHVVPVVDRTGCQVELLAHQVDERRQGRDGGGDEVALDPGDRGLARAGPGG